jgi:Skp family chaperone for outer membrane proteins
MKLALALVLMGAMVVAMPAIAAENAQQNKMKMCQAQAGDKKLEGKERQDYVNNCLKAKPEKKESKIAMCNKKTAGLKGDERSKAQSECMKGS